MTKLLFIILVVCSFGNSLEAKDRILAQTISIQLQNTTIKSILKRIEELGNVKFSYNPTIINDQKKISIVLKQKTIRAGLVQIFENKIRLKEVSNHILILEKETINDEPKTKKRTQHIIKGRVTDKESSLHIPYASVYDVDSKFSALADKNGYFEITIPASYKTISLYYAKAGYRTKVKMIATADRPFLDGSESLYKQAEAIDKLPSPKVPKKIWTELEDKTVSGELFSMDVSTHSENLRFLNENRWAQVSFIPQLSLKAGKNYRGILYNHFSLNILGGYSKGLKGLEIGGIANVLKENAIGTQFGGIANIVGGRFTGLQVAGISNSTKGDLLGIQIGGISNVVRQSYFGIQIAGIVNTINENFNGIQIGGINNKVSGKFNGWQIAGITNSVQQSMNGFQIAGISSLCKDGFSGFQLSGLINHTTDASYGLQISGVQNVALQKFSGAQITGFMNSAIEGSNFFQLAGLLNISSTNNGLQLAGAVNYVNQNNGLQLGLINVSKVNKGLSIGLVNFVWHGYHKIEVFANELTIANIRVKSGVKRFYNIYSIGKQFDGILNLTSLGFGYGSIYNISEKFAISTDIEGFVLFNSERQFTQLAKFSPSFDYKISKHFAIFLGPTANVSYSNSNYNEIKLDEYSLYSDLENTDFFNFWIGGQFGIRF